MMRRMGRPNVSDLCVEQNITAAVSFLEKYPRSHCCDVHQLRYNKIICIVQTIKAAVKTLVIMDSNAAERNISQKVEKMINNNIHWLTADDNSLIAARALLSVEEELLKRVE
ncbi:unnamed protein product, partial [Meganyctiphanes norvegica]